MAKKKKAAASSGGPKKAEMIRDFIQANGGPGVVRNTQVVEGLAAQGVEVKPSQVSSIMKTLKGGTGGRKKSAKKAGRPPRKKVAARAAAPSGGLTEDQLFETKKLVTELGGVDAVRHALETLAKLQA
jgi:hypothetical protein